MDRLIKLKKEEEKNELVLQAFNAWLMGAGGKKKFKSFLKSLNLHTPPSEDKEKMTKAELERVKQRNIANARKIIQLDRINREVKEDGKRSI